MNAVSPQILRARQLVSGTRAGVAYPVAADANRRIPLPVRWAFLLFVFALPFEAIELPFMTGSLSLPRLTGLLFFGFFLLYYGPLASTGRPLPSIQRESWWFLGFAAVLGVEVLLIPQDYVPDFVSRSTTLLQLCVLLWASSALFKSESMTTRVLMAFSLACVCLAIGNLLQIPGFYQEFQPGRITAFGDNPNSVGENTALAIVAIVGLCLYNPRLRLWNKCIWLLLTIPLLAVMVSTGSRGMAIAFVAGCLVYFIVNIPSKRALVSIGLAVVLIAGAVYEIVNSEEFLSRWQDTVTEGSMAGREQIFPEAFAMIKEHPVLGWGPGAWFYELGRRLSVPTGRDAHNLWLALLLEVGIVGTLPFLIGVIVCGTRAWRARKFALGALPLALLITIVVVGLSGTTLISKTQWLVFALAMTSPRIEA